MQTKTEKLAYERTEKNTKEFWKKHWEGENRMKKQVKQKEEANITFSNDIDSMEKLKNDLEAVDFPSVTTYPAKKLIADCTSHVCLATMAIEKYLKEYKPQPIIEDEEF